MMFRQARVLATDFATWQRIAIPSAPQPIEPM
jgi:hypothetical protein